MSSFNVENINLQGKNVIEASAGTGKTYNIQKLVSRLLLDDNLQAEINQILVVTFTEAATAELKERIREELVDAMKAYADNKEKRTRLRQAQLNFDSAAIFTIHGFCNRMLKEAAFESGSLFNLELEGEQKDLREAIVNDFWRRRFYGKEREFLVSCLQSAGFSRRQLLDFAKKIENFDLVLDGTEPPPLTEIVNTIIPCHDQLIEAKDFITTPDVIAEIKENLFEKCSLNKRSYDPAKFDDYIWKLTNALANYPKNIADIARFSKTKVSKAITKKSAWDYIPHKLHDICEELVEKQDETMAKYNCLIHRIKLDFCHYFRQEFVQRKAAGNVLSYDDLLLNLRAALRSTSSMGLVDLIRQKYKAVLIDEFQDTDPVQYEIFNTIFGRTGCPMFMIGDPKQAIYKFRGADIYTYVKAKMGVDQSKIYFLDTNYRSEVGVIDSLNDFFSSTDNQFNFFVEDGITYEAVNSTPDSKGNQAPLVIEGESNALEMWWLDGQSRGEAQTLSADAVANEISRILNLARDGKAFFDDGRRTAVKPADIAILVMSATEANLVKKALDNRAIPAVIQRGANIFTTAEANTIQLLLNAIADPTNLRMLKGALVSNLFDLNAKDLFELDRDESGSTSLDQWSQTFKNYLDMWKHYSFISMFNNLLNDQTCRQKILALPNGERILTNYLHLAELIHHAETENRLSISGILHWLAERRTAAQDEKDIEDYETRLERDDDAVQIMTVFKSKGLEFKLVFSPFLWNRGTFITDKDDYEFHDNGTLKLNIDGDNSNIINAKREELAELMRIMYVALTRARNKNYLIWGNINSTHLTALGYRFGVDRLLSTDAVATGETTAPGAITDIDSFLAGFRKMTGSSKMSSADRYALAVKNKLAKTAKSCLKLQADLPLPQLYHKPLDHTTFKGAKPFNRKWLDLNWGVTSFSALERRDNNRQDTHKDFDDILDEIEFDKSLPAKGFCTFPSGRNAGTCVHNIFEDLDFIQPVSQQQHIITGNLKKYNLINVDNTNFEAITTDMVDDVLNAPLLPDNSLTLNTISNEYRITEMDFFYQIEKFVLNDLQETVSRYAQNELIKAHFPARLAELNIHSNYINGFMNGAIDLIFQHDGKYYILDWKTNRLANQPHLYTSDAMVKEIIKHAYALQYYIYTYALDRYLQSADPGYEYESHFGGVFYLFVRGIDRNSEPGTGIFFDKPDYRIIQSLNQEAQPSRLIPNKQQLSFNF